MPRMILSLFMMWQSLLFQKSSLAFVPSAATIQRSTRRVILRRSFRAFSNANNHEDRLVAHQMETSQKPTLCQSLAEHLEHQTRVFDEMSEFFATQQTIPTEMVPVYQHLARTIWQVGMKAAAVQDSTGSSDTTEKDTEQDANDEMETEPVVVRILDVACGSGALFPFLLEQADQHQVRLELDGVDLSTQMVAAARKFAATSLSQNDNELEHNIQVYESDILKYTADNQYQVVVLNACFGNFWDPTAVLDHVSRQLVTSTGSVVVSHPLGAPFVARLHEEDPSTVPHLLPTTSTEWSRLTRYLPLQLKSMEATWHQPLGDKISQDEQPFYWSELQKVRHVALTQVLRMRGSVASGFGRGGKKLGFPTANLSPQDMRPALESVDTGVYFGWAVLEGRNEPMFKAVVNVGFSPTFEGKENAEKIVEAHLILQEGQVVEDFYGETMRLQLHGFLRSEIKFPSFPALIAQISADRDEARQALDLEPSVTLATDPFLIGSESTWVGSTGGDKENSWEFQDMNQTIENLS